MLLFSLPMISKTSLYYIIGHESLNKTSLRKSCMWWSFDALFCSAGRLVCVCMRDSVCQPTLSGCVGVASIDLLQIAGGSSLIAAPCWPLFQRKASKSRHWSLMGSRLIRPTLIPIITCSKLSSDSHLNPTVLCQQSPSRKGDLCVELWTEFGSVLVSLQIWWLQGVYLYFYVWLLQWQTAPGSPFKTFHDMIHVPCCNWLQLNLTAFDDRAAQWWNKILSINLPSFWNSRCHRLMGP